MGMKKSAAFLLTLCLLSFIFAGTSEHVSAESAPWTEGQGWGYKWIVDFSNLKEEVEKSWEEVDSIEIGGGASEMLYIKYLGTRNGTHVFEFFGGNYVDIYLKMRGKNSSGVERSMEYREKVSVNYNGTFFVERAEYTLYLGDIPHPYYGIVSFETDVGGDVELHLRDVRGNGSDTREYEVNKVSNISYSDLMIEFSTPYPLVPANISDWVFSDDLRMSYSGNRSGHIDYSVRYPNGEEDGLSAYVGKHISGYQRLSIYAVFFSNGTMFSPSILGISQITDLTPYGGRLIDMEEYGLEMNFWQRYEEGAVLSISQSAGPVNENFWSESATEDEVRAYLQDKEAYTPIAVKSGESGENGDFLFYAALSAILLAISVSVALIFRKKGKNAGGKNNIE